MIEYEAALPRMDLVRTVITKIAFIKFDSQFILDHSTEKFEARKELMKYQGAV